MQSFVNGIISNIGLRQFKLACKIKMSKMVTKNKVLPFNQQEEKNEEIFFVKIFKGMERFAKPNSMTQFFNSNMF